MALFSLLLLAFQAVAISTSLSNNATRPMAVVDTGVVAGMTTSLPESPVLVNQFLGIPFAAPPPRFSPPSPLTHWRGIYDASEYKPACIQQFDYPEPARSFNIKWFGFPPPAGESEDCLNLNIWAPANAVPGSRPVLFWIHGGSFAFGSGSISLYDGSSFAANQDVVVVTINYRTNVFGFPRTFELPEGERNLGLLDQRLALDWVQRNIAAFGGDPSKVTIMGESVGGQSVDILVTNPPDPVPFHAAIMQSGQESISIGSNEPDDPWQKLVSATNCSSPTNHTLECIRALPALRIRDIIEHHAIDFGPIPDGGVALKESPRLDRLASTPEDPVIARVPILIGTNANEATPYVYGQNDTITFLRSRLPIFTEKQIQELISAYPIGAPGIGSESARLDRILTEFIFQCKSGIVANESAEVGIDTWRYFFNASFPNSELFKGSAAYHTAEISLVFGTYPREGATGFQVGLSRVMQRAWADFAKNPTSGPGWGAVPQLGVLGGGAIPGKDDAGRHAVTTIDSKKVDQRCRIYRDIYDASSPAKR